MLKCVLFLAFLILASSVEGRGGKSADVKGKPKGIYEDNEKSADKAAKPKAEKPEHDDSGSSDVGGVTDSGEVSLGSGTTDVGGVTDSGEVSLGSGTTDVGGVTDSGEVSLGSGTTGSDAVIEQTTSQPQTQPIYCPAIFENSNYVDPNMVIVAGQSSVSDCQHYCDVNVECKVSSFRTDQTCWVLNSSELGSEGNVVPAPGFSTYLKQDCGL